MKSNFDHLEETVKYLSDRLSSQPVIGLILGTGLGNISDHIEGALRIPYKDFPNFPQATVKGHAGELVFGQLEGKYVVVQNGRFHYYEGYSMVEVTNPVRIFKLLGVEHLIIASAVGGIHESYEAGDISIITDHINLHSENPLTGPNDDRLGPRFPDMSDAYHPGLISVCKEIAMNHSIELHESIYAGLPGPNLETKAEYRYLNIIGATVVGMSTVPEVIVARHMGLKVCGLTAITNKCFPVEAITKVTHEEVIEVARICEHKISIIVRDLVKKIEC